jgi:phytoene synthase
MQLTNIIRDVGEDYRLGRIYLPADELAAAGVAEADLGAASAGPALKAFLRAQAERAKRYYLSSEAGIPRLPDDGSQFTVWLMRHVYAGILDEAARADYDVLRKRATTSMGRKLILALRAWRDYRRTRNGG